MSQDEDSAYACCSFGIGRWCWVVWASASDARAGATPLAEGFEKTADAAEKKAVETAGARSMRLPGKWASGYKRGGSARKDEAGSRDRHRSRLSSRAAAPARGTVAGRPAFLYSAYEGVKAGSRGEVVVVMHRVVRETTGKIYIEREPFREQELQGEDGSPAKSVRTRVLAVDREVLRREGRFHHRGSYFYASEAKGVQGVNADLTARYPWCAALDVSFPCSTTSIKTAYRRLAREKHPDAGGDQAEFQALERVYREALAYFSSREHAKD